MITTLKTYPKYKESSLEWTAGIPSDWEKRRFKFIFNLIKRPINIDDQIITAFRDGTVTLRKNRKEDGFTIALKEIGYQGVRRGDLVISGMDGFAGAIGISDSDGKSTPVYSVCQPIQKSVFPSYYKYLLRVLALSGYISILARGIRERSTEFKWNIIGNLLLVVPDFETQKNIADFLDEKTKVIDDLVVKKEKMIELLREKRAALITRAVTKGLDPKVKMKDSGAEWIGEIPEEWGVKPIRALLRERKENNNPIKTNEILSLSMERGVFPYSEKIGGGNKSKEDLSAYRLAYPGDIVINSMNIVAGSVGLSSYFGAISPVYYALYPNLKEVLAEYFSFVFRSRSFQKSLLGLGNGILVKKSESSGKLNTIRLRIPMHKLRAVEIPYPNFNEQGKIIEYVKEKDTVITGFINKLDSQINWLKEYRASLIYSAVTGKIKV